MCLFGEKAQWLPAPLRGRERDTMDPSFEEGIWLGLVGKSDEDIVGTPQGVVRARSIRRLPADQRWNSVRAAMVR